ncbi:MAG: hypothetical protein ACPGYV_14315, partial [Phycisphaeraceae bacterium]
MSVQPRLIQTDGFAVLSGVQMIVKAGLESGIDTLVASQLDGPAPYADLIVDHAPLLSDKGVQALTLPDARQAIAALQGAWLSGRSAVGVFEALGVVDAAGVLLETRPTMQREPGGVLACFGDSDRSIGQAATALLRRAGWVVIEPTLQDEVKSFAASGLEISRASGRPVALALSRSLMHGAATVACRANRYPAGAGETKTAERASENIDPLAAVLSQARQERVNNSVNPPGKDEDLPLVLIAIGRSFGWTRQAMAELGLAGRLPILRIGMLAPFDDAIIRRHAESCQRVVVLDPTGLGLAEDIRKRIAPEPANEAKDDQADAPAERRQADVVVIELALDAGPIGVVRSLSPWLENHPTLPRELVAAGLSRVADLGMTSEDAMPLAASQSSKPKTPPPGSSLVDLCVVLGRLRRDLGDAQHMLEQHRAAPIDLSIFGELDDAAVLLLTRWQALHGGLECDGRLAGAAAAGAVADADKSRSVVL